MQSDLPNSFASVSTEQMPMDPHYFVCTLGQARILNRDAPHGIRNINQLLEKQAKRCPDSPAIGMAMPSSGPEDDWGHVVYTFSELFEAVKSMAIRIVTEHGLPPVGAEQDDATVAILSESSWDMMLAFFSFIRLGYAVLLLAPQLDGKAIGHMLQSTGCRDLFHSSHCSNLAKTSESHRPGVRFHQLLPAKSSPSAYSEYSVPPPAEADPDRIAYIHHTSGTTSGLPKAIPQPHACGSSLLPCIPPRLPSATFTTTPLYHGGIADMMRSLMSCSMIWLFPPSIPFTAENLVRSVGAANTALPKSPIRLWTSVPYILKMCLESKDALALLRGMDMVGVGGASLEEDVGDALVTEGVNLVSRFGSSECGFLLSSYRDFTQDKGWNMLRTQPESSDGLTFVEQNGKHELVVDFRWPLLTKTNTPHGEFKTSDLFFKRGGPSIVLWKYAGRGDDLVVLSNGRKFDPTEAEFTLKRIPYIKEAVIVGDGRPYPSLLLFPLRQSSWTQQEKEAFHDELARVNTVTSAHARIYPPLVLFVDFGVDWPQSSKGVASRKKVDEVFAAQIDELYQCFQGNASLSIERKRPKTYQEAEQKIQDIVLSMTGKRLVPDIDLFTAGVDSVMTVAIRGALLKTFVFPSPVPSNFVYEMGSIKRMAEYVFSGKSESLSSGGRLLQMQEFVERYSLPSSRSPTRVSPLQTPIYLLTGATGALGAHLLDCLLKGGAKQVICLVRPSLSSTPISRIRESMRLRKVPFDSSEESRVEAIPWDPAKTLPLAKYPSLGTVTVVIHAAWPVHFGAALPSFATALYSTQQLLALCEMGHPKTLTFCSSIASVANHPLPVPERISSDPEHAGPLGYSESKWVAEQICSKAGVQVDIVRIGQLSGDLKNGIWNASEGWPMMLQSISSTGYAPDIGEECIEWLPIDLAADAIIQMALRQREPTDDRVSVYHVLNRKKILWSTILAGFESWGVHFDVTTPDKWLRQLDAEVPGHTMAPLWSKMYTKKQDLGGTSKPTCERKWDTQKTASVSSGISEGVDLDQDYLHRCFDSWERSGIALKSLRAKN